MIRNTKNFNLKKPEQGDFYNVDDFNDNSDIIDAELESRKKAQEDDEKNIKGLTNPEYDDSGTVSGIDSFPAFLNKTKSKMNIFQWYRDFKAGMQFVLHAGQIVNNCVSSDADKPLAAAQGKALQDQLTKLYSDLTPSVYGIPKPSSINGMDNITIWEVRAFKSGKIVCLTINIDGVLSANTDWKILFTLPNEYRPSEGSVILNYITQHGKAMVIDINTGGDVRIVCPSGEGILKGDWACRQCITYVTEA